MAINSLVYGPPGAGKSHALQFLDPRETILINVKNKPLPFGWWQKAYTRLNRKTNPTGNYFSSDNHEHVKYAIDEVINHRHDIKVIVIDDFQYILAHEFMRRATETGYNKFSEISVHAYDIIDKTMTHTRDDLKCVFLSHSDIADSGHIKVKTIGKMLDEKIEIAGLFTIVLYCCVREDKHVFLTKNNGNTIAKSPNGMFDEYIDNNLGNVVQRIDNYYTLNQEIPEIFTK